MTEPYQHNVGRFRRDHPGWVLGAREDAVGYCAWRSDGKGRPFGEKLNAPTLDQLAVLLEREQDASLGEPAP